MPKKVLTFALSFTVAFSLLQSAGFAELVVSNASSHGTSDSIHKQIERKNKYTKSGLDAYDNTPLAQRTPIILIHGIASFENDKFRWENFLNHVAKNQDFQAKNKIYLYHYDSSRSVPAISKDLQSTLKGFIGALGGRSIKILAYSEGGLLTRNALQDSYLDAHTQEVITIATPFHGSPLANPDWINQQLQSENGLSLVGIGQKIAYKITGAKYPTFREDFHWDNFDGAIPMTEYVKDNGPIQHINYSLAKKAHFVTYGSYFGMEVDPSIMQKELGLQTPQPKERASVKNLFRRNIFFSLIRNNIGKLPLANHTPPTISKELGPVTQTGTVIQAKLKAEIPNQVASTVTETLALPAAPASVTEPVTLAATTAIKTVKTGAEKVIQSSVPMEPVSMMMFNDGISPISSSLWLGRYTQTTNGTSIPVDRLWAALKSLKGSKQARLFSGIDHRNWMDGTTRTGQEVIQDLLNPDEPPRTVFDWIIYDLMS